MRTLTRETYYCDHCNKMYLSKGFCSKHEKRCSKNPANFRDCFSCKGLITDHVQHSTFDSDGNLLSTDSVKVFYCTLIDIYVTPPKAENNQNKYVLEKQNIFMPNKCEAKEEKTYEDYINDYLNKK